MANKTMHHVIIGADTYEIVDQTARQTDATLTQSGKAADAKAVGDALSGTGSGVPSSVRQAMKTLFEKAAYIEEGLADEVAVVQAWASEVTAITISASAISINGATTNQLSAVTTPAGGTVTWESSNTAVATVSNTGLVTGVSNGTAVITARSGDVSATCTATVSGFATLTGITATYTQSGTVYDTASLDDLKDDLVVTASYDDSSTETITDYTLSGTLAEGTSTITVSYGGKTTTFTVVVTHATTQYTITNTLTNCTNSNTSTVINEQTSYSGTLTADTGYTMGTVAITMGNTDITSTAYDSSTGAISIASVTGNIVITATATEPPITVNYTYPKTATWNPSAGTLSKAIGATGTRYRIEVDVTSISAASAYVAATVTGSGDASFGDGQSMAGQTGTISWNHTVKYGQEVGATTFKIYCNKGSESSNQTAVISDIRIYEV